MPKYPMLCSSCRQPTSLTVPMSEIRKRHVCASCGGQLTQDYREKARTVNTRIPIGFSRYTRRDFEPPGLQEMDRSDPIRKEYVDKTFGQREI